MGSDPELLAGAAMGFGAALAVAFTVIAVLDNRYVTRREYAATLVRIDNELRRIGGAEAGKAKG